MTIGNLDAGRSTLPPRRRYRLRERREKLGMTQTAVAKAADIPSSYVSNAELGKAGDRIVQRIRNVLATKEWQRRWHRRDDARIAQNRAIISTIPESDILKQALLDRARQLLDAGNSEACDALLEFVPEDDAMKLLDEYLDEYFEAPAANV